MTNFTTAFGPADAFAQDLGPADGGRMAEKLAVKIRPSVAALGMSHGRRQ